jgi:hypothetical protein
MEKFLVALITHHDLTGDRQWFRFRGSATLTLKKNNDYYLLTTNHQAKELKKSSTAFAYLPLLKEIIPITVVAQSNISDIALLHFQFKDEIAVINPELNDFTLDINYHQEAIIYGFPNPIRPDNKNLNKLIEEIQLLTTQTFIVGITYDTNNTEFNDYFRFLTNETVKNGQSGGITITPEGQLLGINCGTRFGSDQGLISPFWDAIALMKNYFNQSL